MRLLVQVTRKRKKQADRKGAIPVCMRTRIRRHTVGEGGSDKRQVSIISPIQRGLIIGGARQVPRSPNEWIQMWPVLTSIADFHYQVDDVTVQKEISEPVSGHLDESWRIGDSLPS